MCSVAQSCPTLCNSKDGSLPGSSIHGIHQARILDSRDHVFQSFDFTWITLKVSLLWSGWLTTQFYKVVRLAQVRLSPETGSSASTGFEKMLEMISVLKLWRLVCILFANKSSIIEDVPCVLEKTVSSIVFGSNIWYISQGPLVYCFI